MIYYRSLLLFALLFILFHLTGCFEEDPTAPVVNAWYQTKAKNSVYRVQQGDTIYSIAWSFGLDYRTLATENRLSPPYAITRGQKLKMVNVPPKPAASNTSSRWYGSLFPFVAIKESKPQSMKEKPIQRLSNTPVSQWQWPAQGRIVERFSASMTRGQGIAIAGKMGQPISASASGEVVYSGDGIRGYGNLIIIKHNNNYLSAYAFNQANLVTVGDKVQRGAVIARMGKNDAGRTLLYFEIRRNGVPVNPLLFLR